eukprot:74775-Chlamydomonas_euryale.AAC.4
MEWRWVCAGGIQRGEGVTPHKRGFLEQATRGLSLPHASHLRDANPDHANTFVLFYSSRHSTCEQSINPSTQTLTPCAVHRATHLPPHSPPHTPHTSHQVVRSRGAQSAAGVEVQVCERRAHTQLRHHAARLELPHPHHSVHTPRHHQAVAAVDAEPDDRAVVRRRRRRRLRRPHRRRADFVGGAAARVASSVEPRLHVVPVDAAAGRPHQSKVSAARHRNGGDRRFGRGCAAAAAARRRRRPQLVLPDAELRQAPCVRRGVAGVRGQHVGPIALARLLRRDRHHGRQAQVLLRG